MCKLPYRPPPRSVIDNVDGTLPHWWLAEGLARFVVFYMEVNILAITPWGQAMPKYEFVAVDFDGTLCADAFPEVGAPNHAVIDYVKRLAADGSKIILYTSRENGTRKLLDEAVAFCKAQEIPLYAVNENPGNPHAAKIGLKPSDGRKVYADLYIDDKAINPAEIERTAEYTRPDECARP